MLAYHDEEWGVPSHDDRHLFEMLTLEGAQAGLSWSTILRKREGYRRAFAGFDPAVVARFTRDGRRAPARGSGDRPQPAQGRVDGRAMPARVLEVQDELGSFDAYLWAFVDGEPIVNSWRTLAELPAETRALARALEGSEAPRLPLRRPDGLLRVHAGGRHGQRPHGRLLPLRRS